jgi:hypothetical protein
LPAASPNCIAKAIKGFDAESCAWMAARTARCLRAQFGIEEPTAGLLQPVEENLLVQKMQEQCGEVGKRFVESRHVDVGRLHEMAGRPARLLLGVREQWLLRGIGIRTTAMGT